MDLFNGSLDGALQEMVERQQGILQSGWRALKPGGHLVFLDVIQNGGIERDKKGVTDGVWRVVDEKIW